VRRRAAALFFAALLSHSAALPAGAQVRAVGPVGITVSDLDAAIRFYTDVLDFEKVSETEIAGESLERLEGVFPAHARVARLRLGDETIELTEWLAPRGRPFPADSQGNDLWFQHVAIVVRDMDRAYAKLREHHVTYASSSPQRLPDWNPNAGGIEAFYFRDPDGHYLELIHFPPGKGDPRWQAKSRRLFLGIDHTAIVVSDTDASLRFYRDALGLRVAGASENWGTEQEHLNAVFGAHLRITALRAPAGPGIELLEYLAPRTGRPRPADARADDLLHWQTDLATIDAKRDAAQVRNGGGRWISSGPVALDGAPLGFATGMLVADPDGHALRLRE
jgi:catechol 2,3-dioxygenase-like lactoylglutathione lyase family enzyme